MAEESPCGMYIRRKAEDGFVKQYPSKHSYTATQWLAYLESENDMDIQHARNKGEYRVGDKKIAVDGFSK